VRHDFAEVVWPSLVQGDSMRTWGCRYARLVLERCEGNKRRACTILGITYHTLRSYLRDAGDPPPADDLFFADPAAPSSPAADDCPTIPVGP
jgi:hypothetical protein